MNNSQSIQQSQPPLLVIDLKKNRIRIHKVTLHLLGNPDYIQIMVNPESAAIALKASCSTDFRAERIRWATINGHRCCEFYSKYLIHSLRGVCFDMKDSQTYRIRGTLIPSEGLARFSMKNMEIVDEALELRTT